MSNAIAVFASARRNGNTGKFIDWIADELRIDVIDLSQKEISPYDYNHENMADDFLPLMRKLIDYETLIFVTPIYWYGPGAQMKVFIDRTSDFLDIEALNAIGRRLRGKAAYIVCTSIHNDADDSFINSLKDTFEYLGMNYSGYVHANCEHGYEKENYLNDVNRFVSAVRDSVCV